MLRSARLRDRESIMMLTSPFEKGGLRGIWDFHYAITAFSAGGFSHVFADSLTLMGVPLGWWSDRRFNLFGGRLRTGQMGELGHWRYCGDVY